MLESAGESPAAANSISVVIPVHNSAGQMADCLAALAHSTLVPTECIVVDDGSTDHSADVARRAGVRVVTGSARRGPAAARNLGAARASGEILLFLDADVCVHADTLERIAAAFAEDRALDAVMGSYDDAPRSPAFCSQYRNLLHCFTHQRGRRQASTFWAGCGAVRRSVFTAHGGFDESYGSPSVEDIEFGCRLFLAGCNIILDRAVLVQHLKHWTPCEIFKTDVLRRGIPWTLLILRHGKMPNDLNLRWSQRASIAAAWGTLGLPVLSALNGWFGYASHARAAAAGSAACLALLMILNLPFYRFLTARRGAGFALAAVPLHFCHHLLNGVSFLAGLILHSWTVAFAPMSVANSRRMDVSS